MGCEWYSISRQSYYQKRKREQLREEEAEVVVAQIQGIRHQHPRMGIRKVWSKIGMKIAQKGYQLGRDRVFAIARQAGLLVSRQKKRVCTTQAGVWRCENLVAGKAITQRNEVWVSDITYVATEQGWCYVSLITDAFSRRIMGFHASASMGVALTLDALKLAIRHANTSLVGLIHHSDRGIQYTCGDYRTQLTKHGIRSSMGAVGNCYENALAERMNGILKQEYGLGGCFATLQHLRETLAQAVWLYNYDRPHLALDFQTPASVYFTNV